MGEGGETGCVCVNWGIKDICWEYLICKNLKGSTALGCGKWRHEGPQDVFFAFFANQFSHNSRKEKKKTQEQPNSISSFFFDLFSPSKFPVFMCTRRDKFGPLHFFPNLRKYLFHFLMHRQLCLFYTFLNEILANLSVGNDEMCARGLRERRQGERERGRDDDRAKHSQMSRS